MGTFTFSGRGMTFSGNVKFNPTLGTVPRGNAFYPGNASISGNTTYSFIVPSNVYSISYVVIGGGEAGYVQLSGTDAALGGKGGGLAYRNNVPVTPGQTVTVVVGNSQTRIFGDGIITMRAPNSSVTVSGVSTIAAGGYNQLYTGGTNGRGYPAGTYDGGALGGNSGVSPSGAEPSILAGGGAAGYTQNGGDASVVNLYASNVAGNAAVTGGGGGGGGSSIWKRGPAANVEGAGGGGVNVYGLGRDGAGGTLTARNGGGGSYNVGIPQLYNGNSYVVTSINPSNSIRNNGGLYGGGGGGYYYSSTQTPASNMIAGRGGPGAVRIVWGFNRAFPSTNVSDATAGNDTVYL